MSYYFEEDYDADDNFDDYHEIDDPTDYVSDELYTKIKEMYDNVFGKFRKCELHVYNPNICHYLSFDKFLVWILRNNKIIHNKMVIS